MDKKELKILYWKHKLTIKQIAEKLNKSPYFVYCKMKKYKVKTRNTSEAKKGLKNPKMAGKNNPNFGKKVSEKTKQKIRDSLQKTRNKEGYINPWLGKKHTIKSKLKMSKKQSGKNNPMFGITGKLAAHYGKHHSEETKEKMRQKALGKKMSKKAKQKIKASRLGKKHSKIIKDKMSQSHKKIKITIEWKENISKSKTGEKNPNWLGGKSFEPYGLEFNNKLRKRIRKRDNFTCQECKFTEKQLGRKLSIHHIDYDKNNNNPKNLIALCNSCHAQTNYKREDWENYFKNLPNFNKIDRF